MNTVKPALSDFIRRSLDTTNNNYFSHEADPEWRSACELETIGEQSHWRPIEQTTTLSFAGLANAAEIPIHPDIQHFYSSFWSGSLQGKTDEGPLSLIQLWNEEDFERLVENLVGHLFMKMRSKQPFTVFFATTEEDSELFLSIDNATGRILLEEPGKPPIREVDKDIAAFLNRLEPDTSPPLIY
ncbi:MAG: SecY interacting protein Syd [Candidatus Azotimanducaceae bacterium]|jgi:SecY interacting protein Syd